MHDGWYTKAQACAILGIGQRTLERYLHKGLIAGARHGGRLWITEGAIRDYESRREQEGDRQRATAERSSRKAR